MTRIKKFLKNCPTWQLRLSVGIVSLAIVAVAILATHGSEITLPLLGEVAGFPGFLIFLGAYVITTSPAWRDALSGGFSMMIMPPFPDISQMKADVMQTANSVNPRTNIQRKRDAKLLEPRKKGKKGKK